MKTIKDMIFDKIENIERYSLPQRSFAKMVKFINAYEETSFQEGKFEIDGSELFGIGLTYNTKNEENCLWEAHRKYIDIHYILEGEEIVHVNDISNMEVSKLYNEGHDYELFNGEKKEELKLKKGSFLILYPNEVHKTSIKNEKSFIVKKNVFKLINLTA